MVLKGQVFLLDAAFAFAVFLLMFSSFLSAMALADRNISDTYGEFFKQKRMLDASEKLITIELAEYSENTLKHHVLSLDKIAEFGGKDIEDIKRGLLLGWYNISITIAAEGGMLLDIGNCSDGPIRRFALCGLEVCTLELCAE